MRRPQTIGPVRHYTVKQTDSKAEMPAAKQRSNGPESMLHCLGRSNNAVAMSNNCLFLGEGGKCPSPRVTAENVASVKGTQIFTLFGKRILPPREWACSKVGILDQLPLAIDDQSMTTVYLQVAVLMGYDQGLRDGSGYREDWYLQVIERMLWCVRGKGRNPVTPHDYLVLTCRR